MSDQPETIRLLVEGSVSTDGDTVYIGGMDLAAIIRASMPGYERPKHPGSHDFPGVTIRVELHDTERNP